ncbi:hypothetical protein AAFF_G00046290 [Aldrovandia affinis]|uniref:Uncharacterized protein n=1 Tax=Aldrovandia affinis TaxID=143900 RepID=A0AAD7S1Y2_9TELE|nr:hypothetical protein AAFF_G00046290 [Aldrovandia affinis]
MHVSETQVSPVFCDCCCVEVVLYLCIPTVSLGTVFYRCDRIISLFRDSNRLLLPAALGPPAHDESPHRAAVMSACCTFPRVAPVWAVCTSPGDWSGKHRLTTPYPITWAS